MPALAEGHAADLRCDALPLGPAPRRVSGRWATTGACTVSPRGAGLERVFTYLT